MNGDAVANDDDWFEDRSDLDPDAWMDLKPKRKPGRPRTVKKPVGVSMREAARELGCSRKKILRMVRDGLPHSVHDERVFIDVEAAQAWIDQNESGADGVASIPIWSPSDPRSIHKVAATKAAFIADALKAGAMISADDLESAAMDACAKFRSALLVIPKTFPAAEFEELATVKRLITGAVGSALEHMAFPFKQAAGVFQMPTAPEANDSNTVYAPQYSRSDPRWSYHSQKAERAKAELAELQTVAIPYASARALWREQLDSIGEAAGAIPAATVARVKVPGDGPHALQRAVFAALGGDAPDDEDDFDGTRAYGPEEWEQVDGDPSMHIAADDDCSESFIQPTGTAAAYQS